MAFELDLLLLAIAFLFPPILPFIIVAGTILLRVIFFYNMLSG